MKEKIYVIIGLSLLLELTLCIGCDLSQKEKSLNLNFTEVSKTIFFVDSITKTESFEKLDSQLKSKNGKFSNFGVIRYRCSHCYTETIAGIAFVNINDSLFAFYFDNNGSKNFSNLIPMIKANTFDSLVSLFSKYNDNIVPPGQPEEIIIYEVSPIFGDFIEVGKSYCYYYSDDVELFDSTKALIQEIKRKALN